MNLNRVLLLGNLVADPVLAITATGRTRVRARVAVNDRYRAKDGKRGVETCYANLEIWGKGGQIFFDLAKKGDPVLVEGRLRYFLANFDGKKRATYRVQVGTFRILPRRRPGP